MNSQTLGRPEGHGLPPELQIAQDAVHLPEVQEMLRKLSAYNLGIFMPHMHTEDGRFAVLPDGIVQVEDGLEVSFRPETAAGNYLNVGWTWQASDGDDEGPGGSGGGTLKCKSTCVQPNPGTTQHNSGHEK